LQIGELSEVPDECSTGERLVINIGSEVYILNDLGVVDYGMDQNVTSSYPFLRIVQNGRRITG
jgi:hypothetical protein